MRGQELTLTDATVAKPWAIHSTHNWCSHQLYEGCRTISIVQMKTLKFKAIKYFVWVQSSENPGLEVGSVWLQNLCFIFHFITLRQFSFRHQISLLFNFSNVLEPNNSSWSTLQLSQFFGECERNLFCHLISFFPKKFVALSWKVKIINASIICDYSFRHIPY